MSTKRIVLIIMCGLLAIMAVLMIVVFSQFVPFLNMLRPQSKPVVQAPSTSVTQPSTAPTTTASKQPTLPSQPPIVTEPGHVHHFEFTREVEATCESPGYSLYTCSCNLLDMRDIKEALGHSFGAGKKITSCLEEGYTEYTCLICDYKDRQSITEPLGHDWQLVKTEEPTCTEDGYELHRCSRCEEEMQDHIVPAPGHTDFDWVESRAPGEGEPGEEVRHCSVCQLRETRDCVMSVMQVQPEDMGDRMEYTIYVGTGSTPHALTYSIKDYSKANLSMEYTEEGLLIRYTDTAGQSQKILLAPLENKSATIDSDGLISGGIPTTPSTPTGTQPSVPTGTTSTVPTVPTDSTVPTVPTVPTGTQPTQPTVPTVTQTAATTIPEGE